VWINGRADGAETAQSGKDKYFVAQERTSQNLVQFAVRCNDQLIGYGNTLDHAKLLAGIDHRKRMAH
jgi:hypothetical protein